MFREFCAAALLAAVPLSAVFAAEAKPVVVTIHDNSFTPAVLTVPKGTAVSWVNRDDYLHSVLDEGGQIESPSLEAGETFSWTFGEAGSFIYHCGVHGSMTGRIDVTP